VTLHERASERASERAWVSVILLNDYDALVCISTLNHPIAPVPKPPAPPFPSNQLLPPPRSLAAGSAVNMAARMEQSGICPRNS